MNYLSKQHVILVLALIFGAGGVSGALVTWSSTHKKPHQPPSMDRACDHMRKKLTDRLGLTEEQQRKIDPILKQTAQELDQIHFGTMQQVDQTFEKCNALIAPELTEPQRAQLEILNRERHAWGQKRFGKGGCAKTTKAP